SPRPGPAAGRRCLPPTPDPGRADGAGSRGADPGQPRGAAELRGGRPWPAPRHPAAEPGAGTRGAGAGTGGDPRRGLTVQFAGQPIPRRDGRRTQSGPARRPRLGARTQLGRSPRAAGNPLASPQSTSTFTTGRGDFALDAAAARILARLTARVATDG